MRRFKHIVHLAFFALAALCLLLPLPTSAQSQPEDRAAQPDIELQIRGSRAARFWAGTAAGVLGSTAGFGTGVAVAMAGCERASDGCGYYAIMYAIPNIAVALPSFTAGAVTWVGSRRGLNGSYGVTWLGSAAGMLVGAAAGVGLTIGSDYHVSPFWTVPLAFVGTSTGALIAHNLSARSRFAHALADIKPSIDLTADRQGAVFSASGTF